MKQRSLSREQVRSIDEQAVQLCGMSIEVLMENAGRGCAARLLELGVEGPVAIVCGKGNNGGDGFVMARHLDLVNLGEGPRLDVMVVQCAPATDFTPAARMNFQLLAHTGVRVVPLWQELSPWETADDLARIVAATARALSGAEWIVDGLFGTGLQRALKAPYAQIIEAMNAAKGHKLAIDLPSGLDCDSGQPGEAAFRADHTCTFVAPKRGFSAPAARAWIGKTHVIDIGAPRRLIEEVLRGPALEPPA